MKKVEVISLKVSAERKEEIKKLANTLGITMAGLINLAISDYIKKN